MHRSGRLQAAGSLQSAACAIMHMFAEMGLQENQKHLPWSRAFERRVRASASH